VAGIGGVAGTGIGGIAGTGVGGIGGGGLAGTGGSVVACGTNTDTNTGTSCNDLTPTGPCVIQSNATGSPPPPTGGQLVAGTYDLTSRTAYAVPDGGDFDDAPRRETVIVTGSGATFTIQISQLSGATMRRQSGAASVTGTSLTFAQTCPPPGDGGDEGGTVGYDADGSSFTIHDMGGNGTIRLNVYTKR
jgi:hypothetical protein